MVTSETYSKYMELTADIVSAFVSYNSLPASELASLIGNVYAALQNVGQPALQQAPMKSAPPVSVRKSITPDYLTSLEDGKQYKSLKRHLSKLGLTPEAYREKWGLPRDYPMVSPNYAARRSELAKVMGLGQLRSKATKRKASSDDIVKSAPTNAPSKRGRKKIV